MLDRADCADFGCHNSIRLETKHFLNTLALTFISFSGRFVFAMQKHYLFFFASDPLVLTFFQMSHACASALCRAIKLQCELYPSRDVALCLDPYSGLGFVLWCLSSVYSGHHSILIPPADVELNPAVWLTVVSQKQGRLCYCVLSCMYFLCNFVLLCVSSTLYHSISPLVGTKFGF